MAAGVGPGWEYYLDRLVAAETGADIAAIDSGQLLPGAIGSLPCAVQPSPRHVGSRDSASSPVRQSPTRPVS